MEIVEERLRGLLLQGLDADAAAYQRFLKELSAHLRAFLRRRDWLRSHTAKEARNDPLDDAGELFASSDSEAAEARRDLGQLLQTLPDKQRLPIEYVKLEGLSVVETARLTGLSESVVKVGVHRGLKALAAKIKGMA
ncbi:sigma factor-like helix-turn-helix DNA-binding protein [Acidovorax sp.]|uniref:sigma factor-like helix-turn-helix DNA-binding protein n=1 Tax=Acidovorax sp. TaxID=1872122 RepID=UPI00391D73EA